jgi:glycosyltransferase involved in cell wall biosynthesis
MQKLSVAIIAQNEADRLPATLQSLDFADEILVLDGGSTDETQAIARSLGARVEVLPFTGFVDQKQRAMSLATHPWVLALDADERVTPELASRIQLALSGNSPYVGFTVKRRNVYLGVAIRFAGWYPDRKLRLVRRDRAHWTGDDPHDRLEVEGPIGHLDADLLHIPYRDYSEHVRRVDRYARTWADSAFLKGKQAHALDLLLRPLWFVFRRYLLGLGFLHGVHGMLLCFTGAWYVFLKYALLYQRRRSPPPGELRP